VTISFIRCLARVRVPGPIADSNPDDQAELLAESLHVSVQESISWLWL